MVLFFGPRSLMRLYHRVIYHMWIYNTDYIASGQKRYHLGGMHVPAPPYLCKVSFISRVKDSILVICQMYRFAETSILA